MHSPLRFWLKENPSNCRVLFLSFLHAYSQEEFHWLAPLGLSLGAVKAAFLSPIISSYTFSILPLATEGWKYSFLVGPQVLCVTNRPVSNGGRSVDFRESTEPYTSRVIFPLFTIFPPQSLV